MSPSEYCALAGVASLVPLVMIFVLGKGTFSENGLDGIDTNFALSLVIAGISGLLIEGAYLLRGVSLT